MSFKYYCHWWIKNKHDLEKLTKIDHEFLKNSTNVTDRNVANKMVGEMYARYCMLVQELDLCLDQLAQPQKTVSIRKLVEAAVFRVKELFNELRWIDFSEYHYIDDALIELKLIPHDIEVLHPYLSHPRPYDIQQMYERLKNGERIYTRPPTPPEVESDQFTEATETSTIIFTEDGGERKIKKKTRSKMQVNIMAEKKSELSAFEKERQKDEEQMREYVALIQKFERYRQAKLYHKEMYDVYLSHQDDGTKKKEDKVEVSIEDKNKAATIIQKFYRGHFCRKYLKIRDKERKLLIGMNEKSYYSRSEFEKEEKAIEERRKLRELRIKEYVDAHLAEKDRILRVVGPGLMEDIGDEIREWFYQWYKRAKNFYPIPPAAKGGTILVMRGEVFTPEEWLDEVERKRRSKAKAGGAEAEKAKLKQEKAKKKAAEKAEKKAKKAALKKAMKEKKKRRNDVKNYKMEFDTPEGDPLYKEGMDEHKKLWSFRDELLNPEEKHYMDLITDERCYEVQLEIREKVDELMRLEYELLVAALARDRGKKAKKPKKPKKKKGKKGKKKKKDMTEDRTTEDLFQELVDNGIIRTYPKKRLDEYVGDFSYNNFELRKDEFLNPPPNLGDIRQAIVMNCILPFGLKECKGRIRSLIICGPPQSGKKLLANAIFTATRCVLFDLSPIVLAGKYPEKPGLLMLVHLILKMAKILEPSILYVDGAEKTFYKKVPPEEKHLDPKRLGKVLFKKIVKTIKADDRIMLVGTCNQPWAASNQMKKAYEKAILIPRSDYNSVYMYWRSLLMSYHAVDRELDLSCVTKLTVKFPLGKIKEIVEDLMTPSRISELHFKPLTPLELYQPFTRLEAVTDKIWKKYEKWYFKTPIGKLGKKYGKVTSKLRTELLQKREQEILKSQKQKKKKSF